MTALVLALVALTVGVIAPKVTGVNAASGDRSDLKNYQHVFIIMMENTGYDSLIGNPNAPWINAAAATDGLATDYHGVTHPSQPNYIAATSGSTNGVVGDGDVTIDAPNIVDQLESHGKTWKGYMQSTRCAPRSWTRPAGTSSTNASTIPSSSILTCRRTPRAWPTWWTSAN